MSTKKVILLRAVLEDYRVEFVLILYDLEYAGHITQITFPILYLKCDYMNLFPFKIKKRKAPELGKLSSR